MDRRARQALPVQVREADGALRAQAAKRTVRPLFRAMDDDHECGVSYQEFISYMRMLGLQDSEQHLRWAAEAIDRSSEGRITYAAFGGRSPGAKLRFYYCNHLKVFKGGEKFEIFWVGEEVLIGLRVCHSFLEGGRSVLFPISLCSDCVRKRKC